MTRPKRLHFYKIDAHKHTHTKTPKQESKKKLSVASHCVHLQILMHTIHAHMHEHTYDATCCQEAVCCEQQLGRDLHLQLIFCQFKDGKILLFPVVVGYSPFGPVIS